MAPTFCNHCGDAVEEGFDPWDELDELDALSDRLRLKRYDLKRNINRFHSPIAPTFCNRCRDAVEKGCDPWDDLAELDALSDRLRLKRYDLKRRINLFHSSILRQLPPDVTSTIFEFCLPDFTDNQLSPYTEEDLSIPLSLGAICSYWRDIAWSTPNLWSSFVVCIKREHDLHIFTGIAEEWLARSGQLPLSICVFSEYRGYKGISALADIINQYSNRWSDLDLYVPDAYYQDFHATDNHAPILRSIRLRSSFYSMNLNFQLTCPRLERACLSGLNYFPKDIINIQWDNLTHLTIHFMSIFKCFLILRNTPRLVFCKISGRRTRYGEPIIGALTPLLTSMRSLRLLIPSSADVFLNNLIAPHLEEFSIPEYYNPSMEVITSFIRISACSLRSFSIIFHTFPPYLEDFMNLLQSMPSLNRLSMISITATNEYFEDTTPGDYDPRHILQLVAKILFSQSTSSLQQGFLPNLKVLEYTGRLNLRPENFDNLDPLPPADNAVHGSLHLLKLDLHPATRIPENMIARLSSLVERGVTVNVLSGSEDILQSSIDFYKRKRDSLYQDWVDYLDSSLFS